MIVNMLACHRSQFFEWLAYNHGVRPSNCRRLDPERYKFLESGIGSICARRPICTATA